MPEMRFLVRWPDASVTACYSPSLVIREHLEVGATYPVAEFVTRAHTALAIASERVRQIHGFPCSRAAAEVDRIDAIAADWTAPGDRVRIEAFETGEAT